MNSWITEDASDHHHRLYVGGFTIDLIGPNGEWDAHFGMDEEASEICLDAHGEADAKAEAIEKFRRRLTQALAELDARKDRKDENR